MKTVRSLSIAPSLLSQPHRCEGGGVTEQKTRFCWIHTDFQGSDVRTVPVHRGVEAALGSCVAMFYVVGDGDALETETESYF